MEKIRNHKGFTIVELVIVIAVIAILSAVLIPTFGEIINNANDSKMMLESKNAYTEYFIDNKGYAPEIMLYNYGENWIPLKNGVAQGVYSSQSKALESVVTNPDVTKLTTTDNSKLFIYSSDGVQETPSTANRYEGKVISILGDSISTLEGYIPVDDGFNLDHRARYVLSPKSDTSLIVIKPEETWWMQVINGVDAKLGINDSWAGSCVSNTLNGNSGDLGIDACMASLTRIQNLGSNGTPDVILFYGGTNDIGRVKNGSMTLGSFNSQNAPSTVDLTSTKWNTVVEAYVTAIMRMQYFYPEAEIIAMLPTYTVNYYNEATLAACNSEFANICDYYGITYVDLRDCGITTDNLPDNIHPNEEGMNYISEAVIKSLNSKTNLDVGENTVYSITHNLTGASASKLYYKGVSGGKEFSETIGGYGLTVGVIMGGVDITDSCYSNGKITIPCVTGNIEIIVANTDNSYPWNHHIQAIPEEANISTNLWALLNHDKGYYKESTSGVYNESGWGENKNVHSITIPIKPGEKIYSTSFGTQAQNEGDAAGVRVAFFLNDGSFKTYSPKEVHDTFSSNGYITAPANAVAVCIPMWNNADKWEVYVGDLAGTESEHRLQQLPDEYTSETNLFGMLRLEAGYYTAEKVWKNNNTVRSAIIAVSEGMRLNANSWGAKGTNGINDQDGIRMTFFYEDGRIDTFGPPETYEMYKINGYIEIPDGVIAINVVWRYPSNVADYLYITNP